MTHAIDFSIRMVQRLLRVVKIGKYSMAKWHRRRIVSTLLTCRLYRDMDPVP